MVLICIFYYSISFSVIKILNFEILIFFAKKFDLEKFSTIFFLKFFLLQTQFYFVFSLIKIASYSYVKMYTKHPK